MKCPGALPQDGGLCGIKALAHEPPPHLQQKPQTTARVSPAFEADTVAQSVQLFVFGEGGRGGGGQKRHNGPQRTAAPISWLSETDAMGN
jgi:hypothetical protein